MLALLLHVRPVLGALHALVEFVEILQISTLFIAQTLELALDFFLGLLIFRRSQCVLQFLQLFIQIILSLSQFLEPIEHLQLFTLLGFLQPLRLLLGLIAVFLFLQVQLIQLALGALATALLTALLDMWLAPMQQIDAEGDPLPEVLRYVQAKLQMSRDFPRESRLFAYEILQGAPHLTEVLGGGLRQIVDRTVEVLEGWMRDGRLASVEPRHLIFSIWAMTQHYADFEIQVRAVLGPGRDPYKEGSVFLDDLYRKLLAP